MGLFQHRPEEPTEWAGLPSEPLEPESAVERLDTAPVDPFALNFSSATSVVVPVAPWAPEAQDAAKGEPE